MLYIVYGTGQVANALIKALSKDKSKKFTQFTRQDLDLQDTKNVAKKLNEKLDSLIKNEDRSVFINCVAHTNVDDCETNTQAAININGISPGILAEICAQRDIKFIHFSTDYVFSGLQEEHKETQFSKRVELIREKMLGILNKNRLDEEWSFYEQNTTNGAVYNVIQYTEDCKTDPINFYGASKLLGELCVLSKNPKSIIIRSAWIYDERNSKNFPLRILSLVKSGVGIINMVEDQIGNPCYGTDIAKCLLKASLSNSFNDSSGIYHLAPQEAVSREEFTRHILSYAAAINKLPFTLNAVKGVKSSPDVPCYRPFRVALNSDKLFDRFGVSMQSWQDGLLDMLAELKN